MSEQVECPLPPQTALPSASESATQALSSSVSHGGPNTFRKATALLALETSREMTKREK